MDDLSPHLATPGADTKFTWQVTMPNVECTNCTLQVIQVMEDDASHGPYDPTPGVGVADIYHQCIDLVLKRKPAPDAGTTTTPSSGCSATGLGAGALVCLLALLYRGSTRPISS